MVRHGKLRWFGHLECKSVYWVSGLRPKEIWGWPGCSVRVGTRRLEDNVWKMIWNCMVRMGNIQGYVEGLHMGQASNPSLAWKKWTIFQNKWWWWWPVVIVLIYERKSKQQTVKPHPFISVFTVRFTAFRFDTSAKRFRQSLPKNWNKVNIFNQ